MNSMYTLLRILIWVRIGEETCGKHRVTYKSKKSTYRLPVVFKPNDFTLKNQIEGLYTRKRITRC